MNASTEENDEHRKYLESAFLPVMTKMYQANTGSGQVPDETNIADDVPETEYEPEIGDVD